MYNNNNETLSSSAFAECVPFSLFTRSTLPLLAGLLYNIIDRGKNYFYPQSQTISILQILKEKK